jgi:hypothetical protein
MTIKASGDDKALKVARKDNREGGSPAINKLKSPEKPVLTPLDRGLH